MRDVLLSALHVKRARTIKAALPKEERSARAAARLLSHFKVIASQQKVERGESHLCWREPLIDENVRNSGQYPRSPESFAWPPILWDSRGVLYPLSRKLRIYLVSSLSLRSNIYELIQYFCIGIYFKSVIELSSTCTYILDGSITLSKSRRGKMKRANTLERTVPQPLPIFTSFASYPFISRWVWWVVSAQAAAPSR